MPRISHIRVYPRSQRGYTVEYIPRSMTVEELRALLNQVGKLWLGDGGN